MNDSESREECEGFDLQTRLALEFDPRLADVWLSVFSFGFEPEELAEQFGVFLRMAYLRGYDDALNESERGELYRKLGVPVPPMRRVAPARTRRTKGGEK